MVAEQAESLRKAIENLINAKLHDVAGQARRPRPTGGPSWTGVASYDIRNAERQLDQALADMLASANAEPAYAD